MQLKVINEKMNMVWIEMHYASKPLNVSGT